LVCLFGSPGLSKWPVCLIATKLLNSLLSRIFLRKSLGVIAQLNTHFDAVSLVPCAEVAEDCFGQRIQLLQVGVFCLRTNYQQCTVITPKMNHSSKLTPIFEGKMNKENTKNGAHYEDKCKVEFGPF